MLPPVWPVPSARASFEGMRRFAIAVGLLALSVGTLGACQGDPDRPPPGETKTFNPQAPGGGGGGGGVTAPEGGANVDAGDAAASCGDLPLSGNSIDEIGVVGEAPAGTGGALTDGVYEITTATRYVGSGVPGLTGTRWRGALRISGVTVERFTRAEPSSGSAVQSHDRGSITAVAANLSYTVLCPSGIGMQQFSYTVNGNSFTWTNLLTKESFVFTRK